MTEQLRKHFFLGPLDPSGAVKWRSVLEGQSRWWGRLPWRVESLGDLHAGWWGAYDQLPSPGQSDHTGQSDQPFLFQPGGPGKWTCSALLLQHKCNLPLLSCRVLCGMTWGVAGETNPGRNYSGNGVNPGDEQKWLAKQLAHSRCSINGS